MEPEVIAALVTAVASLIVALATGVLTQRREARLKAVEHRFRLDEAAVEREAEAERVLDRYRGPLVAAAFDLQERLDNLVNPERRFLRAYAGRRSARREDALKSTLYRVAQFFGWAEILRRDIQYLKFREPDETRAVMDLLGSVARTFADDRYGPDFMVWFEEQRGIGERMITRDGDVNTCVGYATFVDGYEKSYARWLGRFEDTLTADNAERSRRLVDLRATLRSLVERLDPGEERYVRRWQRGPGDRPPEGATRDLSA